MRLGSVPAAPSGARPKSYRLIVVFIGADVAAALVSVRTRSPSLIDGGTSRIRHLVNGRAAWTESHGLRWPAVVSQLPQHEISACTWARVVAKTQVVEAVGERAAA